MIDRRKCALGVLSTAALPRAALAQAAGRPRRIGVLAWWAAGVEDLAPTLEPRLAAQGLVAGREVEFEYHFAAGSNEKAAEIAGRLVAVNVDIIIALATPAVMAAKKATTTIPIVFHSADALRVGIVPSLARPGGNLTGVSTASTELSGKRVELLREAVPGLARIAFLGSTRDPNGAVFAAETEAAGARLGLAIDRHMVASADAFPAAFEAMAKAGAGGVVIQPLFVEHAKMLAQLALQHRLVTASDQPAFARAGILLSYGTNRQAIHRKLADHVVKVLRGAKPSDMPVEQPTEYDLIINQRTAKALGLTLPPILLLRAQEVIE